MTDQHPFPSTQLTPATYAVVAGRPARDDGAPVNPPVVLSSTYVGRGEVRPGDAVYTRLGTETWEPLEEVLDGLERAAEPGLVFASGMAAVSAALELTPGQRLVVPRHYHAALAAHLEAQRRGRRRGQRRRPDGPRRDRRRADVAGLAQTPTSPMLEIATSGGERRRPRRRRLVVVDSTCHPLAAAAGAGRGRRRPR